MIEKEERQLPILRGELALLIVILINSLGVVLMLMSGSGISAISSGIATADSWNLDLCFSGKPDPFSNDIVVERNLCRITYSVS